MFFICRSKSLSALKADSIFHHNTNMSLSIENLLSTAESDTYSLDPDLDPDLEPNQNETLDHELHLDESLFEHKNGTKSEGQLSNPPVPIHNQIRPLPIENLSKKHRKHSDPYITYERQTGTGLRPEHETHSLPRDPRSYLDLQANQSHHISRRTSATSDIQSDISSEFVTDHEGHNRSFKSVRFDVGEDSGMESGPVTGASTPYYLPQTGRRASEPKCKAVANNHAERRGSAPECTSLGSNSDESLTHIGSVESQIMNSKSDASFHSQDGGGRVDSITEAPIHGRVTRLVTDTRSRDNKTTGLELTDIGDSKAPDSSRYIYTAALPIPQDLIVSESSDLELTSHGVPSTTSIAHLIENWAGVGSELALHRPQLAKSVEPVPGKKVATIKQKFQRETSTPGYQPTPEMNRPRLQLSQLVTDTTKQLFQEKPQEKNAPCVITRSIRQAARESYASDASRDSASSTTLMQSSSSQLLTASRPQLDLADHTGKETEAETAGEAEVGREAERSSQATRDAEVAATVSASRLSTCSDLDTIWEESEMKVDHPDSEPTPAPPAPRPTISPAPSPTVSPSPSPTISPAPSPIVSPDFERRFQGIPIFTSPFTHAQWQPWHLQSSNQTPEPLYPNLLGFSNPTFDDDDGDDLEDIDLGNFGDGDNIPDLDDDTLQPLLSQPLPPPSGPSSNFASISPIGKGLFSQRFLSRPPTSTTTTPTAKSSIRHHMLAIKDIKQAQMGTGTGEAFHRLADYHKARVNRLSAIPEESLSGSMCSMDVHALS